jgi:hypothetical protein
MLLGGSALKVADSGYNRGHTLGLNTRKHHLTKLVHLLHSRHDKEKKIRDLGSVHDIDVVALKRYELKLLLESIGAI